MSFKLDIEGVSAGHWTDREGATGCTVVLAPQGVTASAEVRGMAPGTRETDLLSPLASGSQIQAIILCGGSAPGLGAADGVVEYLEERGLGYATPYAAIPLVSGAVIYDLGLGEPGRRPRPDAGYAAAEAAMAGISAAASGADAPELEEGSVGVGTGATVGKVLGETGWMKGGFGAAAMTLPGDVRVAALTVANAFGDVLAEDGSILAGARAGGAGGGFVDAHRFLLAQHDYPLFERAGQNTTLSVVVTNADLRKIECLMVARMAHNGLARTISPVHTPVDGDAVFVMATGQRPASVFQVGTAAVDVVSAGVRRAVRLATSLAGVPALGDSRGDAFDGGPGDAQGGRLDDGRGDA